MCRFNLIVSLVIGLAGALQAQPDSLWSRTYGGEQADTCYAAIVTSDGGYAIVGGTASFGNGSEDFYLVKTDVTGEIQWTQTYGTEGWEQARSVVQTDDGGFILAGVTVPVDSMYRDFMLVKTDARGEQTWCRSYGYLFNDDCHEVIQTADGGFAMIGMYVGMDVPDAVWLVKTDENGEVEWTGTYENGSSCMGMKLMQTDDGDYAMLGMNMVWGEEGLDMLCTYFVVADSNGDTLWSETYGADQYLEQPVDFISTEDGGFAIVGMVGYDLEGGDEGMDDADFFLRRIDSAGRIQSYNTYGSEDDVEMGMSILQTADEGFVMCGMMGDEFGDWGPDDGDFLLIRIDGEGNELWSRRFGGENAEYGGNVVATDDGGYLVVGSTDSFGAGAYDFFILKTGPDPVSVSFGDVGILPDQITLLPLYPNPFNSKTMIKYGIACPASVRLSVYNSAGQKVATLFEGYQKSGFHSMNLNASNLPSGYYLFKLESGTATVTKRAILLK